MISNQEPVNLIPFIAIYAEELTHLKNISFSVASIL